MNLNPPQHSVFFSKTLAVMALFAVINAPHAGAEDTDPATPQKSPRTVIAGDLPKSDHYRKTLRLADGASARGWLGRMPQRVPTTKPESTLPPAAPPMEPIDAELFPAPVSPIAIRRTAEASQSLSSRTGSPTLETVTADRVPLKPTSKLTSSLRVNPISQSDEPLKIPNDAPSEKKGNAGDSNAEETEQPDNTAARTASDIDQLLNGRPLSNVSLSVAQQAETVSGEALQQPGDQAGRFFETFGVYHELPAVRQGQCDRRNQYPLFFNPLYFEDPNMERCGQGFGCLTEFVSAARFFGRVPVVPYMMGANPPLSCVPSLGDCPTCHAFGCNAYLPPLDKDAAALETAFTVGLIFLLP